NEGYCDDQLTRPRFRLARSRRGPRRGQTFFRGLGKLAMHSPPARSPRSVPAGTADQPPRPLNVACHAAPETSLSRRTIAAGGRFVQEIAENEGKIRAREVVPQAQTGSAS